MLTLLQTIPAPEGVAHAAALSGNGEVLVLITAVTVPSLVRTARIYLRDNDEFIQVHTIVLTSQSGDGPTGAKNTYCVAISGDARVIVFSSKATQTTISTYYRDGNVWTYASSYVCPVGYNHYSLSLNDTGTILWTTAWVNIDFTESRQRSYKFIWDVGSSTWEYDRFGLALTTTMFYGNVTMTGACTGVGDAYTIAAFGDYQSESFRGLLRADPTFSEVARYRGMSTNDYPMVTPCEVVGSSYDGSLLLATDRNYQWVDGVSRTTFHLRMYAVSGDQIHKGPTLWSTPQSQTGLEEFCVRSCDYSLATIVSAPINGAEFTIHSTGVWKAQVATPQFWTNAIGVTPGASGELLGPSALNPSHVATGLQSTLFQAPVVGVDPISDALKVQLEVLGYTHPSVKPLIMGDTGEVEFLQPSGERLSFLKLPI